MRFDDTKLCDLTSSPPYLAQAPIVLFCEFGDTSTMNDLHDWTYLSGNTVYGVKIRMGGQLVRDYLPVEAGTYIYGTRVDEAGLYDNVESKFYPYNKTETIKIEKMGKFLDKEGLSHLWGKVKQNTQDAVSAAKDEIAEGYVPLNEIGRIDSTYMPSAVDDILEYNGVVLEAEGPSGMVTVPNTSVSKDFTVKYYPAIGHFVAEDIDGGLHTNWAGAIGSWGDAPVNGKGYAPQAGKIYVNLADNKTYRWGGTELVEISASLALGENSSTAYAGDKGKKNADALNAMPSQVQTDVTNPTATADSVSFGIKIAAKGEGNKYGNATDYPKTIAAATTEKAGVMTATDKSNLDRIIGDTYPFGITSLTASPNLVEVGTELSIKLAWGYKNLDFHPLASQTVNGTAVDKAVTSNTITNPGIEEHRTLSFVLDAMATDGKTAEKSVTVQANHASYHGVAAAGATALDAAAIKAGTKSLNWGRDKTIQFAQDNQKVWYAYPKYFGDLTSVKNSSGFEGLGGYAKATVQVDGVDYLVYLQSDAATATDTYTFK